MVPKTRSSTRPKQEVFLLFPLLPTEIRRHIWLFNIYTPRVIKIEQCKRQDPESLLNSWDTTIAVPFSYRRPVAVDTCKESRDIAYGRYEILSIKNQKFDEVPDKRARDYQIHFNSDVDILDLRPSEEVYRPRFYSLDLKDWSACLRHLEMDIRWVSTTGLQFGFEDIQSALVKTELFSSLESITLLGYKNPRLKKEIEHHARGKTFSGKWHITDVYIFTEGWYLNLQSPTLKSMPSLI